MNVPEDPTLAARMVGITASVARDHYERAGEVLATKSFSDQPARLQAEAVIRQGYRRRRSRADTIQPEGKP